MVVKVLIVEDEKPISDLIKMNLSAAGYACESADNGMRAADLIEANSYDLILLDVMLPEQVCPNTNIEYYPWGFKLVFFL